MDGGDAVRRVRPLPEVPLGRKVCVTANGASGPLRGRLVDLGLIPGTSVRLTRRGPKDNLIAIFVRSAEIALRSEEARSILVAED